MGTTQQVFNNADQLCWTAATTGSCASPPSGAPGRFTRGNRITVAPPAGGAINLSNDQANRLTAYGTSSTYAYNGDGLRVSMTVSGSTSQFLWDVASALPLLLRDGSTVYVYGPSGPPLEQINGSTALWLHHDQLGSTTLVTDSGGAAQATYTFDAYGKLSASTGTISNPLRFTGQYLDSESGLYYLRARYYDSITAQFVSRDPALSITRQPYGYVMGNPLNGADPSGLYNCGLQFWNCITNPFADPAQGNRNFVDNFSNGCWIFVVAPLAVAGGVAVVGIAEGAGVIGGASQLGASRIPHVLLTTAAGTAVAVALRACNDPTRRASQNPPSPDDPNVLRSSDFRRPTPSPTYGPPAPSPTLGPQ